MKSLARRDAAELIRSCRELMDNLLSAMSAFGGKAEVFQGVPKSPLIAISGHHVRYAERLSGDIVKSAMMIVTIPLKKRGDVIFTVSEFSDAALS